MDHKITDNFIHGPIIMDIFNHELLNHGKSFNHGPLNHGQFFSWNTKSWTIFNHGQPLIMDP